MAEIRIEEKKNSWLPILLGVLALLLIGGIAFAVLNDDDDMDDVAVVNDETPGVVADNDDVPGTIKPVAVSDENFDANWDGSEADYETNYIYYLSSLDKVDAEMGLDHEYSKVALMALANSLIALSREQGMSEEVNIAANTRMMREKAVDITKDWRSTEHADMIRNAAMTGVEIIDEIQNAKFPSMDNEVAALEEQAKSIQAGTLTLEQKGDVKKFFRMAADVLGAMRS
jgi:hypothetical protein